MNHPDEMDWLDAPGPVASPRAELRPELRIVGDEHRPALDQTRAVGSPLPTGSSPQKYRMTPPPGRPLADAGEGDGSNRAMALVNAAVPFVQKLLPLLDADFVANIFNSRPQHSASTAADITPVQKEVSELQTQQHDLRAQVLEQNASLKHFGDQLETVRETADRNSFEQQEFVDDLKALGKKVNLFAILLSVMLIVSFILNVVLFMRLKQVIP